MSAGRCSTTRMCLWHLSRTRFYPASWVVGKMCEEEPGGENQCILWSRMEAGEGASQAVCSEEEVSVAFAQATWRALRAPTSQKSILPSGSTIVDPF